MFLARKWRQAPIGRVRPNPRLIALGLKVAMIATQPLELFSAKRLTYGSSNGGSLARITTGTYGRQFFSADTSGAFIDGAAVGTLTSAWSVMALMRSMSVNTQAQVLASINYNGSNVPLVLCLGGSSGSAYDGAARFSGSWAHSGVGIDVRGDKRWHVIGGAMGPTALDYYIDGLQQSTAVHTLPAMTNTNVFSALNYKNDTNVSLIGDLAGILAFDRYLPAAEFSAVASNFWDSFSPVMERRYFLPGGASNSSNWFIVH